MRPEVYIIVVILAIPLFFFWRWVFKRNASVVRRRLLTYFLTLITAPIVYVGIIFCWIWSIEYYPNRVFTAKAWNDNPDTRYEYSRDLIKSKLLIGKTRAQVAQLLGENNIEGDYWYYSIGYIPELTGIDPSSIKITFKNGKVVNVVELDK